MPPQPSRIDFGGFCLLALVHKVCCIINVDENMLNGEVFAHWLWFFEKPFDGATSMANCEMSVRILEVRPREVSEVMVIIGFT